MVLGSRMEITITRIPSVLLLSLLPCMLLLATSAILAASSQVETANEWKWRVVDGSLRATDQTPAFRLRRGIARFFDGGLRFV